MRRQETPFKSVSQFGVWTSVKDYGEWWHEVMLAEQVLIEEFWDLASYGIGSRGKRKDKGIPIWQGLMGQFCLSMFV